ncbi:MAG: hypothetical protein GEU28_06430 [Dehalococcoidia bacterium]|nr:hypothetical protein [Dehalococcoidia bacterium]
MTVDTHLLTVTKSGSVIVLTMNRPEKHNALNRELGSAVAATLEAADADDVVSVAVLTGGGSVAFCAGADMADQMDPERRGGAERAIAAAAAFSKPLIAAVNGYAYGGGALLAAACDLRYGSPASRFRFLGAAYGLVVGASHLPPIVGSAKARELIYTARTVEADEASAIGLINGGFSGESLLTEVMAIASAIAENSLPALRASKQVINATTGAGASWEMERAYHRELFGSEEQMGRFSAAAGKVLNTKRAGADA